MKHEEEANAIILMKSDEIKEEHHSLEEMRRNDTVVIYLPSLGVFFRTCAHLYECLSFEMRRTF